MTVISHRLDRGFSPCWMTSLINSVGLDAVIRSDIQQKGDLKSIFAMQRFPTYIFQTFA